MNTTKKTLICPICGKEFTRTPSQIRKVNVCSRNCIYKARNKGLIKTGTRKGVKHNLPIKIVELRKKQAKLMGLNNKKANYIEKECESCGNKFSIREKELEHRSARFCSLKCTGIGQTGKKNPVWRGGQRPYKGHGWKRIRKEILDRDNHTCQRCGKTKKELGKEPDVHHIVPFRLFKDGSEANDPENLISLCNKCHGVVEFNEVESKQILQRRFDKGYAEIT